MTIKEKYSVDFIYYDDIKEWLLYKHYAKCIPSVIYSFALYDINKNIVGVCCYGTPANNHNNFIGEFKQIELVRLVTNDNLEKNTLSFFISKTFLLLEKPLSLISYADEGKNHCGYIYQATNWLYTGKGGGVDFYIDKNNKEIHSRIMSDYRLKHPDKTRAEIEKMLGWKKIKGTKKHRYFYFLGSKRDKKIWLKEINNKYKIMSYPKQQNKNYDTSYESVIQKRLF